MPYLKIDIDGARRIAAKLEQNATDRDTDVKTLSAAVDPSAIWEGTAARAYSDKYEQWKAAEAKLVEALRELGSVVKQIVNNFDEIERNGTSALGG